MNWIRRSRPAPILGGWWHDLLCGLRLLDGDDVPGAWLVRRVAGRRP